MQTGNAVDGGVGQITPRNRSEAPGCHMRDPRSSSRFPEALRFRILVAAELGSDLAEAARVQGEGPAMSRDVVDRALPGVAEGVGPHAHLASLRLVRAEPRRAR